MSEIPQLRRFTEASHVQIHDVQSAYARWAPIYDLIYIRWLRPGQLAAVAAASGAPGPILDVGVGTGLALPLFQANTRVFGIDLSEPMLRRAKDRAQRERLTYVEGLACMDASCLAFPESCFGCAVLMYVLSVAPRPTAVLNEVARVVKAGGEIILVGHFSGELSAGVAINRWINCHFGLRLGWRIHFPWRVIGDWLESRKDMRLIERRPLTPLGLFTLIRIQRIF
jgi:phosphatidylethanolamine/phosphatidyl-N-methylethanolamine N-methyltransferase